LNSPDPKHPDDKPPVDFEQLRLACDGSLELMRELIDLYFHQADEIMAGLDKGIKEGAVQDVDHLAHKLVGASLSCGMSAMVSTLRQLERGAKEGKLEGAQQLFEQTAVQLEVVRRHAQDYLRQFPA